MKGRQTDQIFESLEFIYRAMSARSKPRAGRDFSLLCQAQGHKIDHVIRDNLAVAVQRKRQWTQLLLFAR